MYQSCSTVALSIITKKKVEKTKMFFIRQTLFIFLLNHDTFMLWKSTQPLKRINYSVCTAMNTYSMNIKRSNTLVFFKKKKAKTRKRTEKS